MWWSTDILPLIAVCYVCHIIIRMWLWACVSICLRPFFGLKILANDKFTLIRTVFFMFVCVVRCGNIGSLINFISQIWFEKKKWRSKWNNWEQLHCKNKHRTKTNGFKKKNILCFYRFGKSSRSNNKKFIWWIVVKSKVISYHWVSDFIARIKREKKKKHRPNQHWQS